MHTIIEVFILIRSHTTRTSTILSQTGVHLRLCCSDTKGCLHWYMNSGVSISGAPQCVIVHKQATLVLFKTQTSLSKALRKTTYSKTSELGCCLCCSRPSEPQHRTFPNEIVSCEGSNTYNVPSYLRSDCETTLKRQPRKGACWVLRVFGTGDAVRRGLGAGGPQHTQRKRHLPFIIRLMALYEFLGAHS